MSANEMRRWRDAADALFAAIPPYEESLKLYGIPEHRELCADVVKAMREAAEATERVAMGHAKLAEFYRRTEFDNSAQSDAAGSMYRYGRKDGPKHG